MSICGDIIPSSVLLRVRAWPGDEGASSSFNTGPGVKRECEFDDVALGTVRVGVDMSRRRDLREGYRE